MKIRTIALALALTFGFTAAVEAKSKPNVRKAQKYKAPKHKAAKYKQPKHA
jgi:hypothetical protein